MSQRFSYVKYDAIAVEKQEAFKKLFEELENLAEVSFHDSRPKSLFLTALEEAYMWTGKAIRDEQIGRGVEVEHVPERSNEPELQMDGLVPAASAVEIAGGLKC